MSFNTFLNNTVEINDNPNDSVICGKIVLETKKWEISYICDFCGKCQSTLPELLGHALSYHIKDVPDKKFSELFGIEIKRDDDLEYEAEAELLQEIFNSRKRQKSNEVTVDDTQELANDDTVEDVDDDKDSHKSENSMDVNDVDSTASGVKFEFLNVNEERETVEVKPKRKCKISTLLQCDTCNAKFPSYTQFIRHKKSHGEKPFICNECGAGFAERASLSLHCLRHKGIKPHACEVCQKAFTTRTEVALHMRRHTGERPFKCTECDRNFISSSDLNIHRRRHTNERPHLCPTCGRTFSNTTSLHDHISTHSTERPHKCTKCNANFANRKGLRQHMQIHADVKKYSCEFCGKTFAQLSGVYSHKKSVHKNEKKE